MQITYSEPCVKGHSNIDKTNILMTNGSFNEKRADLLALLCVMFYCVFGTFPCGVLGQVWYLIVSIPDLCLLSYF